MHGSTDTKDLADVTTETDAEKEIDETKRADIDPIVKVDVEGLAYGASMDVHDVDEIADEELEGLDYGEPGNVVELASHEKQAGTSADVQIHENERAIDLGIVDAGHTIESESDNDTEVADDDKTDGYDADSSEADAPGPAFDKDKYGQVTGGMSEMSIMDTVICVGFGYALVYS